MKKLVIFLVLVTLILCGSVGKKTKNSNTLEEIFQKKKIQPTLD